MIRLTLFLLVLLPMGCGPVAVSPPGPGFDWVDLDGAELASLLNLRCAKYVYSGPEMWCHWRMFVRHYGPDGQLVSETQLGGGGCGVQPGHEFYLSIPIDSGDTAAVRFGSMGTRQKITPPLSGRAVSQAWNDRVPLDMEAPMILAIFAADTKYGLTTGNDEVPVDLEGDVVALMLELVESTPGSSSPWDDAGHASD